MDEKDELYKGLVILLKMFKNRPYHLAKFLTDNSAFNKEFVNKLLSSDKLKELDSNIESSTKSPVHFKNISEMDKFYNEFIDDIKQISKEKSLEELTIDLNDKLDGCIRGEKYEDATRIRDYMARNGIKRIHKF